MNLLYYFESSAFLIQGRLNCNCTECSQRLLDDSVTQFFENNGLWAETLTFKDIATRFAELNSGVFFHEDKNIDIISHCLRHTPETVSRDSSGDTLCCTFKTIFEGLNAVWKAELHSCSPDVITAHLLNPLKIALNNSCTATLVPNTEIGDTQTHSSDDTHQHIISLSKEAFEKFVQASIQIFHRVESTTPIDIVSVVDSPSSGEKKNTADFGIDDSLEELRRRSNLQRRLAKEAEKIKTTPPKRRCLFK